MLSFQMMNIEQDVLKLFIQWLDDVFNTAPVL